MGLLGAGEPRARHGVTHFEHARDVSQARREVELDRRDRVLVQLNLSESEDVVRNPLL